MIHPMFCHLSRVERKLTNALPGPCPGVDVVGDRKASDQLVARDYIHVINFLLASSSYV